MNTAKRTLVAGLMAAALLTNSFGFTVQSAHAAKVPPGFDSLTIACAGLQNHAMDLVHEWYNGASKERKEAILNELHVIGMDWQSIGCQAAFGDLLPAPPPSTDPGQVTDAPLSAEPKTPQGGPGQVKTPPRSAAGR